MDSYRWQMPVLVTACIIALIGIVWWVESTTPNSTQGVTIVGDNVARLPRGEVFVLTHLEGKATTVWQITFKGDQTVYFDKDSLFDEHLTGTLCGVGCTESVDMGWLNGDMDITLRPDGAVNVEWPQGWTYRPYKP